MIRDLFDRDGVRGNANTEPITPETVLKSATAVGECVRDGGRKFSGYLLEPALTAGFITFDNNGVASPGTSWRAKDTSLRNPRRMRREPALKF
jgi:hypothetical protein